MSENSQYRLQNKLITAHFNSFNEPIFCDSKSRLWDWGDKICQSMLRILSYRVFFRLQQEKEIVKQNIFVCFLNFFTNKDLFWSLNCCKDLFKIKLFVRKSFFEHIHVADAIQNFRWNRRIWHCRKRRGKVWAEIHTNLSALNIETEKGNFLNNLPIFHLIFLIKIRAQTDSLQ